MIQRLREADQSVIAEEAYAHWTIGERVEGDAARSIRGDELRADFEKADSQGEAQKD